MRESGLRFDTVPTQTWLAKLVEKRESGVRHDSLKMLDVWLANVSLALADAVP